MDLTWYFKLGVEHYGYPRCCVVEFLARVLKDEPSTPEQIKVAASSGFIPCREHTLQILQGKTRLQDLIASTRQCKPFPDESCSQCREQFFKTKAT